MRELELNTEFKKRRLARSEFKTTQQMPKKVDNITYERHVYTGPQGDGYTLVAYKTVRDKTFISTEHYGPESRKDTGGAWVEVKEI